MGQHQRMVPEILEKLEFQSNSDHYGRLIKALDFLKRYGGGKLQVLPQSAATRSRWRRSNYSQTRGT